MTILTSKNGAKMTAKVVSHVNTFKGATACGMDMAALNSQEFNVHQTASSIDNDYMQRANCPTCRKTQAAHGTYFGPKQ